MKAAAVERKIDDLSVIDHLYQATGLGTEQRSFSGDLQLRTCSLDADSEFHASRLADGQLDSIPNNDLKSGGHGTDTVDTGIQRGNYVIAARVAGYGLRYVGSRVRNRDACAWNDEVLWVVHVSHDAARLKLRKRGHVAGRDAKNQ